MSVAGSCFTRQVLALPDGAQVTWYGGLAGGRPVLFSGRTDFMADSQFRNRLLAALSQHGFEVLVYERPGEVIHRRVRSKFKQLPLWPRLVLKGLLLLAQPTLWRHFRPANRRRYETIEFQIESFRIAIGALGLAPIVIGRSAGARVASFLADELALAGVVCLGYPFKHPSQGDEPGRYVHLAGMRTPCLIIQGDADEYGDIETVGRYALSPSVRLEFVPADHGMKLQEMVMQTVLDLVVGFAKQVTKPSFPSGRE